MQLPVEQAALLLSLHVCGLQQLLSHKLAGPQSHSSPTNNVCLNCNGVSKQKEIKIITP